MGMFSHIQEICYICLDVTCFSTVGREGGEKYSLAEALLMWERDTVPWITPYPVPKGAASWLPFSGTSHVAF